MNMVLSLVSFPDRLLVAFVNLGLVLSLALVSPLSWQWSSILTNFITGTNRRKTLIWIKQSMRVNFVASQ